MICIQIRFVKLAGFGERPGDGTGGAFAFGFDPIAYNSFAVVKTSVSKLSRKILPSILTLPKYAPVVTY
ncbi:MAG TPA: hypothetical protein VIK62_06070 [Verrucomicrobiae bacterium]